VELDIFDIYSTIRIEIDVEDSLGFKRVHYNREIIVSGMERDVRIVLNELGVSF